MEEIVAAKKLDIQSASPPENSSTDLVTQLCKGYDEQNERKSGKKISLTNSEVFGNLFVFIVAGHETTASSLHMTILLLAMHPEMQKELQKDLSEILQGRPPSEWDYKHDLPRLQTGFLGAVWNEELRLVSPVLTIPKVVSSTPQEIIIDGRQTMLPANLIIRLCLPSVQVNPKFWPRGPPTDHSKPVYPLDNSSNDLEEFKPRRWLKTEHDLPTSSPPSFDFPQSPTSERPSQTVPEATNYLFTPIKGSFLPFSEGHRSCLGRRFAQVEILAALAVIFSQYSVELAVDQWASDEEVSAMMKDQKRVAWKKASEDARWKWKNKMVSIISVQMGGGARVPLRIVRQGEERFFDL
jgi:cytochrome P450